MSQLTDVGVGEGKSFPLGATRQADGVNFSVYSKNATTVELLLFDSADGAHSVRTISLDPVKN
jgi:isoamylase